MDEQRKYAMLFAATILAARKLNDPESKPYYQREPLQGSWLAIDSFELQEGFQWYGG